MEIVDGEGLGALLVLCFTERFLDKGSQLPHCIGCTEADKKQKSSKWPKPKLSFKEKWVSVSGFDMVPFDSSFLGVTAHGYSEYRY